MKCTPDEILALSVQKLHPCLDPAFTEAGMPVEPSSASSGNNLNVTGLILHSACYDTQTNIV